MYLQSIWAGYGGIRWSDHDLQIHAPHLLPNTTQLVVRGIAYLGSRLLLEVRASGATLSIITSGSTALLVSVDGAVAVGLTKVPSRIGSHASVFAARNTSHVGSGD